MGQLTEFFMKSPGGPPPNSGFTMPMMKGWVPRRIQPWIYVLTALCFQFSGGVYLGALDSIRGTTNLMIEDVLFLLYSTLAGMAVYFPMLFRMKFRFTNQQLLCCSAVILCVCNLLTMYCQSMPILAVACFIAGMAKIQGTFECMSNIQLWITPRRDFAVFFPVLHIILLTAIEGSGWLAAWFAHHFSWQMMHVFTIATMSFVLLTQVVLCRPFCPMPHRLSLKGMDFQGGLVVCGLTLVLSYIVVYGDYLMWLDSLRIRILTGIAIMLFGIMLYRLHTYRYPYVELSLFTRRNVVPILIVTFFAELAFGAEHTMEEILYSEVIRLEELTKESQYMWVLLGMYVGILLDLYWLKVMKWKIWKLFGIAFISITFYAMLMYFTLDMNVNIEQYRLAIFLRGFAYAILSPALMWALNESVPSLEQFFMGLFVFNILHMYFAGAAGYGIYTTIFSHFMNENMMSYGHHLTLTRLDIPRFDIGDYIAHDYLHSMMMVTIKQVYGYVIWFSLALAALFLLCDIPAVRTNIRKVPRWSVYAIDYLAKKK
ncbi:MAG: hypothetical protein MR559_04160 [Prevotella sp.]|nr:hypothetical protein [Prevotella sp.]